MLRRGRQALESEVGETFTVSGVSFVGMRRDDPRAMPDPLQGTARETVISAARSAFAALPETGRIVGDGTNSWRIAEVRPGALDTINLICIGMV